MSHKFSYTCRKTIVIIGHKAITFKIVIKQEIGEESYRIKLSALFHDLHLYSRQPRNMLFGNGKHYINLYTYMQIVFLVWNLILHRVGIYMQSLIRLYIFIGLLQYVIIQAILSLQQALEKQIPFRLPTQIIRKCE